MSLFTRPTGYPTCLLGYVHGPIRWETDDGESTFIGCNRLFIFQMPTKSLSEGCCGTVRWVNSNTLMALTHLQKKSRFGFLLMWPFCFHIWLQFRFQKQDEKGGWIPGSEIVWYMRSPGWRWDAGDGKFILTKGYYLPGHWD